MLPFADRPQETERRLPIVTLSLIAINVLIYLYTLTLPPMQLDRFVRAYGAVPQAMTASPASWAMAASYLTVLSSLFLHGSVPHLLGNVVFLWVFGDNVEGALGHVTFAILYTLAGLVAGLVHILAFASSTLPTIGASGAIAGVLGAYVLLFPRAQVRVLLFFGPFFAVGRAAALLLIFGWFVLQVMRGVGMFDVGMENSGGVAYLAHVGGFLAGATLTAGIRALRHQPMGSFAGRFGLNWTFRNWLAAAIVFAVLLALAGSPGGAPARQLQAYVVVAAAVIALADGSLRAIRQHALLGEGRGVGRWVAILQLIVALAVLVAWLT
jgi:membrane associated rhomboid family serine protease